MLLKQIARQIPACLFTAVMVLNSLCSAADFAGRAPTEEEVLNALDPPKVRGIVRPGAAAKTLSRPSLSMELQFEFDSAKLVTSEENKLAGVVSALKSQRLAGKSLDIIGHTDARGSSGYNKRLSERRAMAVVELLSARGIDPKRLKSIGMGKVNLKNTADPFAAENRRVEFVIAN